jgi:DNA-directed RNA polymerase sigma subunit (sigma70/sigma32)
MQIEAALQRQLPYTPLTTDAPELIDRALFRLPYREREFVKLRFGLNGPEHSLQQISEIWKITTARVRQVLNNAIRKLQHPTTARLLENAFKSQPFEQERLLP